MHSCADTIRRLMCTPTSHTCFPISTEGDTEIDVLIEEKLHKLCQFIELWSKIGSLVSTLTNSSKGNFWMGSPSNACNSMRVHCSVQREWTCCLQVPLTCHGSNSFTTVRNVSHRECLWSNMRQCWVEEFRYEHPPTVTDSEISHRTNEQVCLRRLQTPPTVIRT